jgi:hypothetical protein
VLSRDAYANKDKMSVKSIQINKSEKYSALNAIFNSYTDLIFYYPTVILILCLIICTVLPIGALIFYPVQLDNNPEKVYRNFCNIFTPFLLLR